MNSEAIVCLEAVLLSTRVAPTERLARARALRDNLPKAKFLARDPEWAAPVLWRSEFRNIRAGYIRRKAITFDQACALQDEAESLIAGPEFEVESSAVLETRG